MCGITGIIGPKANTNQLKYQLDLITHRGEPSYQNETYSDDNIALGTHRLAIVDENNGQQPKTTPDNKVVCILNGEVYNHNELRLQLKNNYIFESNSDTEAVLAAYLYWGDEFINHLEGQFSIAIYDKRIGNKSIIICDRMGIKSLYYYIKNNTLYFASELKALISTNTDHPIHNLAPGHYLLNGTIKPYYKLKKFSKTGIYTTEKATQLRKLLEAAVCKRIPNQNDTIACMLSGGLDSSILTYLASKYAKNVKAYTLAAAGTETEDIKVAKQLCHELNIDHVLVTPEISEMQNIYIADGVRMTESFEPTLVRNACSFYFVSKAIRDDGFKFCFSGEGADELFGGYDFVRQVTPDLYDDIIWHSLDIISKTYLHMSDRSSMWATLESRVPYLDDAVVEFALAQATAARISATQNKIVLRDAFKDILPDYVVNKRKVGMNEGAGYGVNNDTGSVYHQAILNFYQESPKLKEQDLEIAHTYNTQYNLNLDDIEEVFNFSKFISFGYHNCVTHDERLQLNGHLIT